MKRTPRAAVKQRSGGKSGTPSKSVRIDLSQHEKLASASLEIGKDVNQMMREAVDDYIKGYLAGLLAYHRSQRGNPAQPTK